MSITLIFFLSLKTYIVMDDKKIIISPLRRENYGIHFLILKGV